MNAEDLFPTLKRFHGDELTDAYTQLEADCRRVADALDLGPLEREIRNRDAIEKYWKDASSVAYQVAGQPEIEAAWVRIGHAAIVLFESLKEVTHVD